MRERGGRTLAQVFGAEEDALSAIRQRIAKGTAVHADESPAWNKLHAGFVMQRLNHQIGYSIDGACTNGAESYFSRLRRGELGHHHHIAGPISPATPRRPPGAKTSAASATGSRRMALSDWRCAASRRSISAATGSAPEPPD
jgi:hypothetical protein